LLDELSAAERGALGQPVSQLLEKLETGEGGATPLIRVPAVAE
jgi:hypothetical protein